MLNSEARLSELLTAHVAVIGYVTYEESRAIRAIHRLSSKMKFPRPIYVWDVINGLCLDKPNEDPKSRTRIQNTEMPAAALKTVMDMQTNNRGASAPSPGIFVFKDLHHALEDVNVIRLLRDAASQLTSEPKTIILLAPDLRLPVDLEKDIVIVDLEYPDEAVLGEALNAAVELGRSSNVDNSMTPELRQACIDAGLGLTLSEFDNACIISMARDRKFNPETIAHEKAAIVRKNGVLEFVSVSENLNAVGGMAGLKDWVRLRKTAFSREAKDYGLDTPKGVLLTGLPGTGKSLMAKIISAVWERPLIRLDLARAFGSLVGQSEQNVRMAIKTAEAVAPCILWLDEVEKSMGTDTGGDGGTSARVLGMLLTWMSEKTAPVFVVATANDITKMPPELLRKGRFDEIFFADLPTSEERAEIFSIHLRKKKRDPSKFDISSLVAKSEDFSGSEIEQAVKTALYSSFDAGRELTSEDVEHSLSSTIPLAKTMAAQLESVRDWAKDRARPASIIPEMRKKGQVKAKRAFGDN